MPVKPVKSGEPVLGLMVTSRVLHAVLVRVEGERPVVIQRFIRHRSSRSSTAAAALTPSAANFVPELQEEVTGSDFTLQFGGEGSGSSSGDLFLRSEFTAQQAAQSGDETTEGGEKASNFMFELSQVLDECRKLGYDRLPLAFCAGSSEVAHLELQFLPKEKKGAVAAEGSKDAVKSGVRVKAPSREKLFGLLKEQYKGKMEEEAVAFLPMTITDAGVQRYLAFVPKPAEPVAVTLKAFRKQKDERPPNVRLLDTEASIYAGMARAMMRSAARNSEAGAAEPGKRSRDKGAAAPDISGHTLLVRAGAEDTLLYFFDGEQIRHYESMRSLTAFDSPDTICSRVLLQQDEYGVEEVQRVFVLSEERETELIESFRTFFPDAEIRSLRETVPSISLQASEEMNYGAVVPALGAALRVLDLPQYRHAFEEVNLLPKRLVRQNIELPFTWHVMLMATLLFGTSLFFAYRYVTLESQIDEYRDRLARYPPSLNEADPRVLQARIDSMQAAYNQYIHALGVLDTLLMGSDKWSRGLEQLSRETAATRGIWVESWVPKKDKVEVTGSAVARDRVVGLAERTQGDIQSLTFSEIREWPVYSFSMNIPLRNDLPEAAKYLRERALDAPDQAGPSSAGTPGAAKQAGR